MSKEVTVTGINYTNDSIIWNDSHIDIIVCVIVIFFFFNIGQKVVKQTKIFK